MRCLEVVLTSMVEVVSSVTVQLELIANVNVIASRRIVRLALFVRDSLA